MDESDWERQRYRRATDLMVAEYSALRDEIVKRIEVQYQVLSVTLIAAAAFLGLGAQSSVPVPGAALLLYPILALFLAIAWVYNGIRIVDIGAYLQSLEAASHGGLGWEQHVREAERSAPVRSVVAARGVFVTTQLLAMGLAIVRNDPTTIMTELQRYGLASIGASEIMYAAFLVIDAFAVIYTLRIIRRERRASRAKPKPMPSKPSEPPPAESPVSGGS